MQNFALTQFDWDAETRTLTGKRSVLFGSGTTNQYLDRHFTVRGQNHNIEFEYVVDDQSTEIWFKPTNKTIKKYADIRLRYDPNN